MATNTVDGVTTLTPTAWKWLVGAAFTFFLIPPFGMLIALVFVLTGLGVLQRITLTPDGLKVRNWFSEKTYAWSDIDDFRVQKLKSGVITAANMVSFTHVNQQGTMIGKAAKLLAGGTHSIPAVGMKPQTLVRLMQAYKAGHVPANTPAAEPLNPQPVPETPAPISRERPEQAGPRAVPAAPRTQISNAKPAAKFGGRKKGSTPLVQDGGGLFGRRRSDSPFRS